MTTPQPTDEELVRIYNPKARQANAPHSSALRAVFNEGRIQALEEAATKFDGGSFSRVPGGEQPFRPKEPPNNGHSLQSHWLLARAQAIKMEENDV